MDRITSAASAAAAEHQSLTTASAATTEHQPLTTASVTTTQHRPSVRRSRRQRIQQSTMRVPDLGNLVREYLPSSHYRAHLLRALERRTSTRREALPTTNSRECLEATRARLISLLNMASRPEFLSVLENLFSGRIIRPRASFYLPQPIISFQPRFDLTQASVSVSVGAIACFFALYQLPLLPSTIRSLRRLVQQNSPLNTSQQNRAIRKTRQLLIFLSRLLTGVSALTMGTHSLTANNQSPSHRAVQATGFSMFALAEFLLTVQSAISLRQSISMSRGLHNLNQQLLQLRRETRGRPGTLHNAVKTLLDYREAQRIDVIFDLSQHTLLMLGQSLLAAASLYYVHSIIDLDETPSNEASISGQNVTEQQLANFELVAMGISLTFTGLIVKYVNRLMRTPVQTASAPVRLATHLWQRLRGQPTTTNRNSQVRSTDMFELDPMASTNTQTSARSSSSMRRARFQLPSQQLGAPLPTISEQAEPDNSNNDETATNSSPPSYRSSVSQVSGGFSPLGRGQLND